MNRDQFEQLVSQSLDDPSREDLRATIDAATRENPELAGLLDDWRRFDEKLSAHLRVPPDLDWPRFHARVSDAIESAAGADNLSNTALDQALRASPALDEHVDWQDFRRSVAARLDASPPVSTSHAPRPRLVATVAALLATAAALLLAVQQPSVPSATGTTGLATVMISPPAAPPNDGVAIVRMIRVDTAINDPEAYFVIDPPTRNATPDEPPGYYY